MTDTDDKASDAGQPEQAPYCVPGPEGASEYVVIQQQRREYIRLYNFWYAFGQILAHVSFWLLLTTSLTIGSAPVMIASAIVATLVVWFSYRMVLGMDRSVVALYPRIIFLELLLGYDFYRSYLRQRPRGNTERSFVETCEQIANTDHVQSWAGINSNFKENDFPPSRRLTVHFKMATVYSVVLFWAVIALILVPQYFQ